jgi:hypothetical protein
MVDLGLFSIIFLIMFVVVAFGIFRTFGRVSRFQNRIFDHVEDQLNKRQTDDNDDRSPHAPRDYHCDQCGAVLGDDADVSPSGDFKCTYCGKWSNIHS